MIATITALVSIMLTLTYGFTIYLIFTINASWWYIVMVTTVWTLGLTALFLPEQYLAAKIVLSLLSLATTLPSLIHTYRKLRFMKAYDDLMNNL